MGLCRCSRLLGLAFILVALIILLISPPSPPSPPSPVSPSPASSSSPSSPTTSSSPPPETSSCTSPSPPGTSSSPPQTTSGTGPSPPLPAHSSTWLQLWSAQLLRSSGNFLRWIAVVTWRRAGRRKWGLWACGWFTWISFCCLIVFSGARQVFTYRVFLRVFLFVCWVGYGEALYFKLHWPYGLALLLPPKFCF